MIPPPSHRFSETPHATQRCEGFAGWAVEIAPRCTVQTLRFQLHAIVDVVWFAASSFYALSLSLSCCFTDEHERSAVLILPDLANIPPFATVVSSSLQPRANLLQRRRRPLSVPLLLVTVLPPQNLKKKYGAKWALVTVSVDVPAVVEVSGCAAFFFCGMFAYMVVG